MAFSLILLFAVVSSAPAEDKDVEVFKEKEDLEPTEKDDLKTAASHWGGHYGWGGHVGHWGGGWGGYYPYYGSYWGWPHGYGYWPYGGYYGHHGYWW